MDKRFTDIIGLVNDIRALERKYPDMGPADFTFACHHAAWSYHNLMHGVVHELGAAIMKDRKEMKQ